MRVMRCRLTTQAQRPGARDATIATTTLPPGSLQRMVRPLCVHEAHTANAGASIQPQNVESAATINAVTRKPRGSPVPKMQLTPSAMPSDGKPTRATGTPQCRHTCPPPSAPNHRAAMTTIHAMNRGTAKLRVHSAGVFGRSGIAA